MREFLSDVGCRIIENEICENEDELSLLKNISTCILNDVMHRLYGVNPKIKLLNSETAVKMIGRACTVKTAPGDTLLLHHALELARENDVIVADGQGETQRAVGGEIILRLAQMKGISGIVVDGVLRDISGIQELTMPVFALGTSNIGPWKNGPGEINVPVSCGGQAIRPGDILVGDADGVVVIPKEYKTQVIRMAMEKQVFEENVLLLSKKSPEAFKNRISLVTSEYLSDAHKVTEDKNK